MSLFESWCGVVLSASAHFVSDELLLMSIIIYGRLAWAFLAGLWCLWIVFFFSGLVAYATYSTCDPFTSGKVNKPDQIIPFLVTDKLGHIAGVSGLFVAAVYGGVLR